MGKYSETAFGLDDAKRFLYIKGARVHNLKNIDAAIPKRKLTVFTGVSGSGKSSLAFDTIYAEGQRRYVESLSAYVRQFLERMEKPEADYIKGIAPAMAIEQKVNTRNPRSTVGTSTEVYDYLRLLYARTGKTISPVSGNEVKKHSVSDAVDFILTRPKNTSVFITYPLQLNGDRNPEKEISVQLQKGFTRLLVNDEVVPMEKIFSKGKSVAFESVDVLVDRLVMETPDEETTARLADSVQTAFLEGEGICHVHLKENNKYSVKIFSDKFEADGMKFEIPTPQFFSFNNPYGACTKCEGFGRVMGIDEDLVIPDKSKSVHDDAVACWRGEKMSEWKDYFIKKSIKFDFPIHRSYFDLTKKEKKLLWHGNPARSAGGNEVEGIYQFFTWVETQFYKIQYRVLHARYRGYTTCPECEGTRLRKDAAYVKINSKSISELVVMSVEDLLKFFEKLKLTEHEQKVAVRLLTEIKNRLSYLVRVGLGYLTLNRLSNTLSGGESQRINLASSLGSSLVDSIYILDEPSIGLHPRDGEKLIGVLKSLRDVGNTVIVVEHDEKMMQAADHILDLGPRAGELGGEVIFEGNHEELLRIKSNGKTSSLTAQYLRGEKNIPVPKQRRKITSAIEVIGARENNLKNLSVKFPLHAMTVITGVSGSGKTTLVKKILYPALKKMHESYLESTGQFENLEGDYKSVKAVELIDQNPIGKSSRSNPVSYVKAYDIIRNLFSEQPISQARGYKANYFSFNVDGGRCDTCKGEGYTTIEMQFMADLKLVCETCGGKRFKDEMLEAEYHGKNIVEVLEMTVDEAIEFFSVNVSSPKYIPASNPKYEQLSREELSQREQLVKRLKTLADVGLGYIRLGQSASTLSGGEAQRVKLASFLNATNSEHTLYIFDEPTTGLHFDDIHKLLKSLNALIEAGHSVIIIEHNLDVIKCADWIIDLGPLGGDKGGYVVFEGRPEEIIDCDNSFTGRFLKEKLN